MMIEWFINVWGPALVVLGVWFLMMRLMMKGSTAQKAQVAEMQRQSDAHARIAECLDRIATALEQRKP